MLQTAPKGRGKGEKFNDNLILVFKVKKNIISDSTKRGPSGKNANENGRETLSCRELKRE